MRKGKEELSVKLVLDSLPDDIPVNGKMLAKLAYCDSIKYICAFGTAFAALAIINIIGYFCGFYNFGITNGIIYLLLLIGTFVVPYFLADTKKYRNRRFDDKNYRTVICEFSEDSVRFIKESSNIEFKYKELYRVAEFRECLILLYGNSGMVKIMPRHIENSQAKELKAFLKKKIGSKYVKIGTFNGCEDVVKVEPNDFIKPEGEVLWSHSYAMTDIHDIKDELAKKEKRKVIIDVLFDALIIIFMAVMLAFSEFYNLMVMTFKVMQRSYEMTGSIMSEAEALIDFIFSITFILLCAVSVVFSVDNIIQKIRNYRLNVMDMSAQRTAEIYEDGMMFRRDNDSYSLFWEDVYGYKSSEIPNHADDLKSDGLLVRLDDDYDDFYLVVTDEEKVISFKEIMCKKLLLMTKAFNFASTENEEAKVSKEAENFVEIPEDKTENSENKEQNEETGENPEEDANA